MDQFEVVTPTTHPSQLQQFARYFHQDWNLLFSDFRSGVLRYLPRLTSGERAILKAELVELLSQKAEGQVLETWYFLGAQWWPPGVSVRDELAWVEVQL